MLVLVLVLMMVDEMIRTQRRLFVLRFFFCFTGRDPGPVLSSTFPIFPFKEKILDFFYNSFRGERKEKFSFDIEPLACFIRVTQVTRVEEKDGSNERKRFSQSNYFFSSQRARRQFATQNRF